MPYPTLQWLQHACGKVLLLDVFTCLHLMWWELWELPSGAAHMNDVNTAVSFVLCWTFLLPAVPPVGLCVRGKKLSCKLGLLLTNSLCPVHTWFPPALLLPPSCWLGWWVGMLGPMSNNVTLILRRFWEMIWECHCLQLLCLSKLNREIKQCLSQLKREIKQCDKQETTETELTAEASPRRTRCTCPAAHGRAVLSHRCLYHPLQCRDGLVVGWGVISSWGCSAPLEKKISQWSALGWLPWLLSLSVP